MKIALLASSGFFWLQGKMWFLFCFEGNQAYVNHLLSLSLQAWLRNGYGSHVGPVRSQDVFCWGFWELKCFTCKGELLPCPLGVVVCGLGQSSFSQPEEKTSPQRRTKSSEAHTEMSQDHAGSYDVIPSPTWGRAPPSGAVCYVVQHSWRGAAPGVENGLSAGSRRWANRQPLNLGFSQCVGWIAGLTSCR